MVQSWEQEQAESRPNGGTPGHLAGARHYPAMPRTTPHYTAAHHRLVRQGYSVGPHLSPSGLLPPGTVYINNQILDWVNPKKYSQMLASGPPVVTGRNAGGNGEMTGRELVMSSPVARPMMLHGLPQQHYSSQMPVPMVGQVGSPGSASSTGSNTSAAASFFARAAQKLNISSRKKSKRHQVVNEPEVAVPHFPTNFHEIIRISPPPAPPCLMRTVGRMQNPGTGKVKVMLRICPVEGTHQSSFLTMDPRKKQVTVYDPSCSGYAVTAASRRTGAAAPKMFAFDAVFSQDDSLAEICASSLVEIVQAVVNGADGCLFCYGHARLGKTYTMIGVDDSPQNLGIIPCAIAWLFKLINEQKEKTGARFSVRVSAVEVTGKQERLKDLLADVATGQEAGSSTAPGVYLREDPICGTQLENQSELRAPTAERATFYLDAAVAARTVPEVEEDARNSHLLFTLHVYQYRVEKSGKASHAAAPNPSSEKVAGGRSRLHLVDLGSCSKSKDGNALSLSALGNVILALLNGQRHVPHRESKLTQLIRESLGNLTCRTCMIAHVSPGISAYNETLQVIQLAARIHRMRRRKNKFSSTSSEESSSCDESGRMRPRMRVGVRMGTLREDAMLSHSDPDYTSSSEQSCDTVIYVGKNGQALSDRELTDNEGPPSMVPVSPHPQGPKSSKVSFNVPHSKTSSKGGRIPAQGSGMRMGTTHTTNATSPAPGVVQLPRKLNMKAKPPMFAKPKMFTDGSEQGSMHDASSRTSGCSRSKMPYNVGSEQWIDGPACPQTSEIQGEQWIDGPQAYNQPGSQEHWVDGPTMVQPGQQWSMGPPGGDGRQQHGYNAGSDGHDASQSKSERWIDGPNTRGRDRSQTKAPSASEMWVDGPTEFVVGSEDARTKADKSNKMWTEMPKQAGSAGTETSTAPKSNETDNEISGQAPSKPLRNPAVLAAKDQARPCSINSDSNSNTSLAVNHSRPISTVSSDTTDRDPNAGSQLVPGGQEPQEPMCINSFVKDWVEKHSVISSDSTGGGQSCHKYPRKHHTLSIPKKDILSRSFDSDVPHHRVAMTMDDSMLFTRRKLGDSERVSSCHSSPRVKHVKRSMLPPPANPLDRTFAWIKSLDGDKKKEEAGNPPTGSVTAAQVHRVLVHNEEQPPPYESCVDDLQGLEVPEFDSLSDKVWYTPEELVGTPMTTSSLPEPMTNDEAAPDYTTLMLTNRESVYEIQMDEQLEAMKGENGLDTTLNSEDGSVDNFSLQKQEMLKDSSIIEENKELDFIDEKHPESDESPVDGKENLSINADAESGIASSSGGHLSPPSSDDSDKSPGKRLIRPTCLRRPDGASNPNLSSNDPESKDDEFSSMQYGEDSSKLESETSSPEPLPKPVFPATSPSSTSDTSNLCQSEGTMQRSALGQLPEDGTPSPKDTSPTRSSKLPTKTVKPPLPSKPSPPTRGSSLLTKFGSKKSPNKSSELPKANTKSNKAEAKAEAKGKKDSKAAAKDKKNVQKQIGSPTPSSSGSNSRPSSVKSSPSRLPTGKSKSNQSSPTKSTCSSKDSKGSGKDSKSKDSGKDKGKDSGKDSKGKDSKNKDSKNKASGSKIPSPTKKEKDSKVPVSKVSNNRVSELSGHKGRGTDSDSGNDSGIGKSDKKNKKLLSPYSTVTQPRVSTHSSSGHGSDASSTLSGHLKSKLSGKKAEKVQGGASSGYESMLRDSEVTGTSSSTHDSTSESSSGGRIKGTKILKKKAAGTRRSRSAPPSRTESPASSRRQSPAALGTRKTLSPASPRAWVDTRHLQRTKDEPFELKVYDVDDVERMQRRRKEEAELRALERRRERIRELLIEQEALKMELLEAKDRLMIEQSTWSFDLYVAEQMDRDDPNYLEALEKETKILEKRVDACKSHIMMVTCFDINV